MIAFSPSLSSPSSTIFVEIVSVITSLWTTLFTSSSSKSQISCNKSSVLPLSSLAVDTFPSSSVNNILADLIILVISAFQYGRSSSRALTSSLILMIAFSPSLSSPSSTIFVEMVSTIT